MIQVVFNALICPDLVLGGTSFVCYVRIMFCTKDPSRRRQGVSLLYRPDLLTDKGRRLHGIGWACTAAAFLVWMAAICAGLTLPKA